jgi:membrane protein DedA with SNARE-associated domain
VPTDDLTRSGSHVQRWPTLDPARKVRNDEHPWDYSRLTHHLTSLIAAYGSWLVAGIIALECIGIPLPGETILVAAAIYAGSTQELSIWSVIVAAILGGIAGNLVAFWIGRRFGYGLLLRYGSYIHMNESRIKIGQYLFLRYGSKVVFFARFVPVLRSVAGFLAGANYMPWRSFMFANVTGAIAWVSMDCLAAYYLGREVAELAGPVGMALGAAFVVALVLLGTLLVRREKDLGVEAERALPGPLRPVRAKPGT